MDKVFTSLDKVSRNVFVIWVLFGKQVGNKKFGKPAKAGTCLFPFSRGVLCNLC